MIARVFPKVSWCLGKTKSCEKKILANFQDNVVLYFNILQRRLFIHCIYLSIYLFINYLFINLFIYQLIYLSTYLYIYSSPYLFIIYLVHQEFINVISY